MKARKDTGFPNEKTFSNFFGSKKQLIGKVEEYCQKHGDYDDVLKICAASQATQTEAVDDDAPEGDGTETGLVYLIKSGKRYKIGHSGALERRERELAWQVAEKPSTVHTIRTDDPSGIEAYWHRRFAEKRKYGEWFELSADDVRVFKRRKFM